MFRYNFNIIFDNMYILYMYYVSEKINQKRKRKTKMINEKSKLKMKITNEKLKLKKRKAYSFRLSMVSSNNCNSDLSLFILCTFVIRSATSPTS